MFAEKTVLLPVSTDEAFALITEPDRLRRWKTVSARVDLRAGGQYRWTVIPGHVAAGTFVEVEPGRRIVFGWGWEGSPDLGPDASTVTITLEPAEGGTWVHLVHHGLTDEQAASHLQGWNHFLARLERAASTGDAGPDEWAAAPAELTPLTSAQASLAVCQDVLRRISEGDLNKPTPCSEFTIGQLADHLIGSMLSLGAMAGAAVIPADAGTVESRVAFAAQQALEAWDRRGLEGTVKRGERDMPAVLAASIVSLELLVHGWDFAVATGQQVTVSDEVSRYVLDLAYEVISPQARQRGSFAGAVEVGPGADILERLIAFSGRTAARGVSTRHNDEKEHDMAKFILLYRGPATPQADITPEEGEQLLQAWNAWMGKVGDALLDGGAPFAGRTAVAGDGSTTSASDLNGYTIVQAPDLAAAKTLCGGNPFLDDATADFVVEIYELAPM